MVFNGITSVLIKSPARARSIAVGFFDAYHLDQPGEAAEFGWGVGGEIYKHFIMRETS